MLSHATTLDPHIPPLLQLPPHTNTTRNSSPLTHKICDDEDGDTCDDAPGDVYDFLRPRLGAAEDLHQVAGTTDVNHLDRDVGGSSVRAGKGDESDEGGEGGERDEGRWKAHVVPERGDGGDMLNTPLASDERILLAYAEYSR